MRICENGHYRDMTEEEVMGLTVEIPPEMKIAELKQNLADTDYITLKIVEGAATFDEYADILAKRKAWRKEINELEETIVREGEYK